MVLCNIDVQVSDDDIEALRFAPYANYQACAPYTRNWMKRDDEPEDGIQLTFLPFVNDPEFDIKSFINDIERFEWQSQIDPDCKKEIIVLFFIISFT